MQLFTERFPSSFNLFLAGDTHEGSTLQHRTGIEKLINAVSSPYQDVSANYLIHMGDTIEGHTIDHPYYNEDTHEPKKTPFKCGEEIARKLMPIRKQILYIHMGNHDLYTMKVGNITRDVVCKNLGCKYGTWTAKLTLLNKRGSQMFKIFTVHGYTNKRIGSTGDDQIRRMSNMRLQLKKMLYKKAGDCLVMGCGHYHRLLTVKPHEDNLYLIDDGEEIQEYYAKPGKDLDSRIVNPDARWYFCSGAFYKLYSKGVDSYAEIAGYDPVQLGYMVLRVRNQEVAGLDEIPL